MIGRTLHLRQFRSLSFLVLPALIFGFLFVSFRNEVFSGVVYASAPNQWPMFKNDLARTGYSTSMIPETNQTAWRYQTAAAVRSSPAVANGVVYVGSFGGNVYALNAATGAEIWNYTTTGDVWSSPAVADGVVYVGSNDWTVYALNATTGTRIWNHTTGSGVFSSPAVVGGVVYVGSCDTNTYALNASTGAKIWNYSTGNQVRASPAVVNGVVYIASEDGYLYALDATTGAKLWSSPTSPGDSYVCSSPAVANGMVCVGAHDGNVYAFDASTGVKKWSYQTGNIVESSPSIVNNVVYVGSDSGYLYALNATTGNKEWSYVTGVAVYSSPAVAGGVVYIGSWDGTLYALDASNGTKIWSYATGGGVFSSPAIANGMLYVGSYDAYVYAFGTQTPQQALSVDVSGQGTTNATGTTMYDYGLSISVQASPSPGWTLSSWLLNGTNVGSENPHILTLNASYTLTAVFTQIPPNQFSLYVAVNGLGSTNSTGTSTYDSGSVVSVQAIPGSGWVFSYWLRNDSSVGSANPFIVTLNANINLTAVFILPTLTASKDLNGTVTPMQSVRITVNATGIGSDLKNATLYYSLDNWTSWSDQLMTYNVTANAYEATIPGQQANVQVNYRVVAYYNAGNNETIESYYSIENNSIETAVWVPSGQNAAVAAVVTVGTAAAVSTLASASSAAGASASQGDSRLSEKFKQVLPDTVKKWLADSVSSKSKLEVKERVASRFILTKEELVSYAVTVSILTLAFAYAKAPSLSAILASMPMILATSVLVDLAKTYAVATICRHFGVWTEHRLWYLGMGLFAFSTLAFKVPFSSPSRLAHYSPKMTKRIGGMLGSVSILLSFTFALAFLALFIRGYTLIGNIGVIMCLTGVFFDTIPIAPMGGKNIYDWNKIVWLTLFLASIFAYVIAVVAL